LHLALIVSGIRAAAWLGLLWYAAPLVSRRASFAPADRLRDALILGTAVPFALAALGILNPWTAFALAVALALWRRFRVPQARPRNERGGYIWALGLPLLAVVAVAWPALVRPLLHGDSLGYHLPNAAAWAHDGTLWLTTTAYWFYPGASELFAAGLLTAAGPFAIGLAGTVAALLLGLRIASWLEPPGSASGAARLRAASIATATLTAFVIAQEAANLDNDVWLAAFFLETLWAGRHERGSLGRSAALCALVKPYGFSYALVALAVTRAPLRSVLIALGPFAFWIVRDALLWPNAIVAPGNASYHGIWSSTILAHGYEGLATLARALVADGLWTALLFAAGLATIAFSRDRALRAAALAALVFFAIEPFAFDNNGPQLATGASLRYALPLLAIGAITLVTYVRTNAITPIALAFAVFNAWSFFSIFLADATTKSEPIVLAIAALALFAFRRPALRTTAIALTSFGLIAYAVRLAGSHPIDYYNDWLSGSGAKTELFTWIAEHEPSAIVAWQLRAGSIVMVSPETRILDGLAPDPCAEAKSAHALLVAADDPTTTPAAWKARRERALDCGPAIYRDGGAVVVAPL
jgi:hypothetical protein